MVSIMHIASPSALLTAAASVLLVINSSVATSRALARGDPSSAAFAAASTLLLAALLATVRAHERAAEAEAEAGRRRRLRLIRAVAWALSAALTAMFAHRVAGLAATSTPAVAALVWSVAVTTVAGGFFCLFVQADDVAVAVDVRQEPKMDEGQRARLVAQVGDCTEQQLDYFT